MSEEARETKYVYRPFVGFDKDGTQLLVSVFVGDPGLDGVAPIRIELAKREDKWDTWSAPIHFEEAQ